MSVAMEEMLMLPEWDRNDGLAGEEEELKSPPPGPLWVWQSGAAPVAPLACSLLLVSCREEPTALLTSVLRYSGTLDLIGSAVLPDVPLPGISHLFLSSPLVSSSTASSFLPAPLPCPPMACCLYRYRKQGGGGDNGGVLVATIGSQWPDTRSADLVTSLLSFAKPAKSLVLGTLSVRNYSKTSVAHPKTLKTGEDTDDISNPEPPFLRALYTDEYPAAAKAASKDDASVPSLELPNMVGSMEAALISHFQVFGMAAAAFLSLTTMHHTFEPLLAYTPVLVAHGLLATAAAASPAKLKSACASLHTHLLQHVKQTSKSSLQRTREQPDPHKRTAAGRQQQRGGRAPATSAALQQELFL